VADREFLFDPTGDEDGVQLRVQIFLTPRKGYERSDTIQVTNWKETLRSWQQRIEYKGST
jgi:hypothetical protein